MHRKRRKGPSGRETKSEKHPSFGVVTLSRVSGQFELFQSDLSHQHVICLRVHHAEEEYDEFGHTKSRPVALPIAEVFMSETQFARLITSIGAGAGSPCTISRLGGKSIDPPPRADRVEWMKEKASEAGQHRIQSAKDAIEDLRSCLASRKRPTLKQAESLLGSLELAVRDLEAEADFHAEQFKEIMEGMVAAAKTEIEEHAIQTVQAMGIEALADSMPRIAESKEGDGEIDE